MFLAIDPGVSTGWAVLDACGTLIACGAGEGFPILSNRAAIIERPQVYRAGKSKGDPNDLITLAIRVGRYVERLSVAGVPVEEVLPNTWKGQLPKDIHHVRTDATLSKAERELVERFGRAGEKRRDDNVWDAVALAKWAAKARRFAISQIVR